MFEKFSKALEAFSAEPAPTQSKSKPQCDERLYLGTPESGFSVPREIENLHFLIGGTTGSGKTRFFLQMGAHARKRGDKAFIVDHGGEQISRFYRPGDIVLNPFDARFPGWTPFSELRGPWDADNVARYLIPDGVGSGAAWNSYAQAVTAALLRRCLEEGQATTADWIRHAIASPADQLQQFVGLNEPAYGMLDPKNDRMFASVRGIMSTALAPLRYVRDGDFSIRNWVQDDDDRRWVFITYQDSMFGALRSLVSAWVSMAVVYCLDLPENESRRVWFLLDEIGTLDRMTALIDALTKIRKRGGCVVAGLQALSQFVERYGREGATTLLANFRTWITLATGDAETAELFSRHFGEQEIWRQSYGDNQNFGNGTSLGENVNTSLHEQRVVKYTELMTLPSLACFVKAPGNVPVFDIRAPIIQYPTPTPIFVPAEKPFVHDIRPLSGATPTAPVVPRFGG